MDVIDTIFPLETEVIEKLKSYVYKLDYEKIFFEHLGPELKKIFINKKDRIILKNFLEGLQYEYGFFDTKIDLQRAFDLYKKYADLNDYFCMYKMHIIYLCEYEKFNIPFNRILGRIYLLKCFAYLPNYLEDWDMKIFEIIDVKNEIEQMLDLEGNNLETQELFFDLLYNEKEKYNLSENDINLMKGNLLCYFYKDNKDSCMVSFSIMNSLIPKNELDYAYYNAKNKCIFHNTYLKLGNIITDSEKEKFYKEIESKKLYEFYGDYGNYLLDKKIKANPEIIEIISDAANNGHIFNTYSAYQCLIDYYDLDEIMEDYNKASMILNYLLDDIVFEKLLFSYFIQLIGLLIQYSKFPEKIMNNYLKYVKEINDYINSLLIKIETGNDLINDQEYYYIIKAFIYYFGFKDIEKQNFVKAIELLDKSSNVTQAKYLKKNNEFFKYKIKEVMFNNNLISNDELIKAKKDLIEIFNQNLNLKYQIVDRYIIGKDFFEGITRKKDEFIALLIFNSTKNIFISTVVDCYIISMIKKTLKNNENKLEDKLKEEICGICYTNKVTKIFIPCKHTFCDFCAGKLEEESNKCPVCRQEYLYII